MFLKRIDRILSEGEGKQLAWLTGIVLALFIVFCLIGRIWGLDWTDILTLYLDPGNFPIDHKANDIFSLIVTLSGILILSALMISVFSNVFSNISEAYRKGERRYPFKSHVLILGGGRMLPDMLKQLLHNDVYKGKDIVIMSGSDIEALRERVETMLDDPGGCNRIIWYRGERDNEDNLRSARVQFASAIYLIGEDGEKGHDAVNVKSMELLTYICRNAASDISCYVTLDEQATQDIFHYLPSAAKTRLHTEIIGTSDYVAEQLLVDTDFIPVPEGDEYLHLVITGQSPIAGSFATVASQICHFPNYVSNGKRTRITFIGENMKAQMESFVSMHQSLFELSHYDYVTEVERTSHTPNSSFGDFIDIEWEFIDCSFCSRYIRDELARWANDPAQKLAIAVCGADSANNLTAALHLPKSIYSAGIPVAVYQSEHGELMEKAKDTGMFGKIICFGEATQSNDALMLHRSLCGKRINYLYDRLYGNPPAATADEAWYSISFAHQLSSIASANSIPVKLRSFGLEPTRESVESMDQKTLDALSEVEHRRWMASVLLMGYSAATKAERADRSRFKELKTKFFIHLDIAPFDELGTEAQKDLLIIKNIPYIINGDEIV